MALLESVRLPLGMALPAFTLQDPTGKTYTSDNLCGERGLLVAFTCNHCPYAQAVWPRLIQLGNYARGLHIGVVAINPNINPDYPDDAPNKMQELAERIGITFPYLVDHDQSVAQVFQAQCTPDIFLFDGHRQLAYHGRVDDNWKDASQVRREELKEAIKNMATGIPIDKQQHPSMGCSIKWKL